jgi:hypothetical protein
LSSPFFFRKNDFILVVYGSKYYDKITNEMLMEQFMEMKSMIINLQSEIDSRKNPVDDFTTKWVDTYYVMAVLRVCHRTKVNYMKAGNHTPTRIQKRNYFAINK